MFILAISNFWENIVEAINQVGVDINGWNWSEIITQVKNVGILAATTVVARFAIPYFKSKKQFALINKMINRVQALEAENQTVGNILTEYISLQSETNAMSRTLTDEQKDKFKLLSSKLKTMQSERLQSIGEDIEEMVEDNVITAQEAVELSKNIPEVEKALGTKISDIGK